jgi:hypothetical protein
LVGAEDVREGSGEGSCGLDGGEVDFADVIAVLELVVVSMYSMDLRSIPIVETKDSFALVGSDTSTDSDDVLVKCSSHEFEIRENERFLRIESHRDYVFGVLS